jgi:hypothetical protein
MAKNKQDIFLKNKKLPSVITLFWIYAIIKSDISKDADKHFNLIEESLKQATYLHTDFYDMGSTIQ